MTNTKTVFLNGTKNLFFIQIVSLIVSMIGALPFIGSWFSWIGTLIRIGMVFILFQLAPVRDRYRKAAILMAIAVGGTLLIKIIDIGILSFVSSVCSLVAIYQEYKGHSEMMKEIGDYRLADKWHGLFYWQVFGGALLGILGTPILIALVAVTILDEALLAAVLVVIILGFDVIMSVLYLIYMKRMRLEYEQYASGGDYFC